MRVRIRSLAVLAVAVAGCQSDSLPLALRLAAGGTSGDVVTGLGTVEDLRARKAAWLATGPANYLVMEGVSCMCGGRDFEPAVVEVRARRVTRVWNYRTGERFVPRPGTLLSIEQLFDRAIDFAEQGKRVIIEYDAELGYPIYVSLDQPELDAGYIYALGRLRAR